MNGRVEMVVLCERCQSINPDDTTICYKCGLKLIPKAEPYSILRTPMKPILVIDFSLIAVGILIMLSGLATIIDMIQHSNFITALANQSTPEVAQTLYDGLSNYLFDMRIAFIVRMILGGFLTGLGLHRLRKKGVF